MHAEWTRIMATRGWIVVSRILVPVIFALRYYSCGNIVLHGKGDFVDVIMVIYQLTLDIG